MAYGFVCIIILSGLSGICNILYSIHYYERINDYFILRKACFLQKIRFWQYRNIRFIHLSKSEDISTSHLSRFQIQKKIVKAADEAMELLEEKYTYIATTYPTIVRALRRYERQGKIKILGIKSSLCKCPNCMSEKDLYGYRNKCKCKRLSSVIFIRI